MVRLARLFPGYLFSTPSKRSTGTKSQVDIDAQDKNIPSPGISWRQNAKVDPHHYTHGRWLHQNNVQQSSRYLRFNFQALCERILRLIPEASIITDCEKKEGGFNRIFIFTLDNDIKIVARLPTHVAGPPNLTTESEVATMSYIKAFTLISVPRILDYSADAKANDIGAEYIIMEYTPGTQLHKKWTEMNTLQRMKCTEALSALIGSMVKIDFPAYGGLYFKGSVPHDSAVDFRDGYCIGPHCRSIYWNTGTGEMELYGDSSHNHGPWLSLESYCRGIIDAGRSRLPKSDNTDHLSYHGSINEHLRLLSTSQTIYTSLVKHPLIRQAAIPTLLHADFHKRNIYVDDKDPTRITGIIDWQSTSIEPAFIQAAEQPDFAALPRAQPFSGGSKDEPQKNEKETNAASICYQTFDVCLKGRIPKLRVARQLDERIIRPFLACHSSWVNSVAAIRQDLIDCSEAWEQYGQIGPCPFTLTNAELIEHNRQYKDLSNALRLKDGLMDTLDVSSDGWVQEDRWESVSKAYVQMYQTWIDIARKAEVSGDDTMTVDKAKKIWPFDIDI